MVFNSVPLETIAGLTDLQIRELYCRERDENGKLIRHIPETKEEKQDRLAQKDKSHDWESMYKDVKRTQSRKWKGNIFGDKVFPGWSEEEIDRMWQAYLRKNPQLKEQLDAVD